ncbi:hypothetical protein [Synechococcus sp. CCY9202]|uniref:hypothetical protein n=1 Tax=Synechococcus sp. CCY9202 TaxID=174698 RepID=UPI002B21C51F|nr:hypothetical protein [Synechococcus sp. CCY9202]MEA5423959.1 hypothetical protein [Synechococcus sp. CCY9202]
MAATTKLALLEKHIGVELSPAAGDSPSLARRAVQQPLAMMASTTLPGQPHASSPYFAALGGVALELPARVSMAQAARGSMQRSPIQMP